jgi:hypothetical protein
MKSVLLAVVLVGVAALGAVADTPVRVYVNGTAQRYSPPAVLRGDTVYVPLRAGATSLGLSVKWHEAAHSAQVCSASGCALIRQSDGITVNNSLLVPLRRMGEVTGAAVRWDASRRAVFITK